MENREGGRGREGEGGREGGWEGMRVGGREEGIYVYIVIYNPSFLTFVTFLLLLRSILPQLSLHLNSNRLTHTLIHIHLQIHSASHIHSPTPQIGYVRYHTCI